MSPIHFLRNRNTIIKFSIGTSNLYSKQERTHDGTSHLPLASTSLLCGPPQLPQSCTLQQPSYFMCPPLLNQLIMHFPPHSQSQPSPHTFSQSLLSPFPSANPFLAFFTFFVITVRVASSIPSKLS